MRSYWSKYNFLFFLLLVFLLAEAIVQPFGNFPLNDDWCYAKSVSVLLNEGRLDIGTWPAMTLASHIIWGFLFVKILGFSFFVLRLSTLISAAIGLFVFFRLIQRISGDKVIAFISCATLLLNPLYFNMCNTYMTDINFLTVIILCIYFGYDFFANGKHSSFILVYVFSLVLILIRQYGIIVPAAMTFAVFFLRYKKMYFLTMGIVLSILVYTIFHFYEEYLRSVLPPDAAYQFSGENNPTRRVFWDKLLYGISTRYKIVSIHALFYTFPLVAVYLADSLRVQKKLALLFFAVPVFWFIVYLYEDYPLQVGNVFLNAAVGADTFYETQKGTYVNFPHDYSAAFMSVVTPLKYILISLSFIAVLLFFKKLKKLQINPFFGRPQLIFLLSLFVAYVLVILITESFFDRYQLPVIAFSLLMFSYLQKTFRPRYVYALVPLLFLFYMSVFGTRDYFTINNKKWEAYAYLKENEKAGHETINAGFEVSCWDNGRNSGWHDYLELENFNYLIQYKSEEGFTILKEYPFQRYFPFKKDTLRIYRRTQIVD